MASPEQHPVRKLFDAGLPIILNTDDPALFGCTLTSEYELARQAFGFTQEELASVAANSLKVCVQRLMFSDLIVASNSATRRASSSIN